MITTADALEIMAVVAACHPRTAPRMDDPDVARATAGVWAELINEYDFTKPELIAAVKSRAKGCPDAPEVADIIRVARATRNDHLARTAAPSPPRADEHYPGDAIAALDMPEFPAEWDAPQRLSIYWYALRQHAMPRNASGWQALAKQLAAEQTKRADAS